MDGMSRVQLDRAESRDAALGRGPMRPRDAATLILLDRRGGETFVLMGRRHARHAFMPGKFVFPGGRTDAADSRVPVADGLHPAEEEKIAKGTRIGPARVRAIALSAVRETYEEAGLLIGRKGSFETARPGWQAFAEHDVRPSLGCLRFVARAITPPGRVRRFDTRFLACWRSEVAVTLPEGGPTDELEEIAWLPLATAGVFADLPVITRTIVGEIEKRLQDDPQLEPGGRVPFFRMIHNRFVREIL
jgi:8-oxo-dGTP pyrophosphatase MutT (NUDIX family)